MRAVSERRMPKYLSTNNRQAMVLRMSITARVLQTRLSMHGSMSSAHISQICDAGWRGRQTVSTRVKGRRSLRPLAGTTCLSRALMNAPRHHALAACDRCPLSRRRPAANAPHSVLLEGLVLGHREGNLGEHLRALGVVHAAVRAPPPRNGPPVRILVVVVEPLVDVGVVPAFLQVCYAMRDTGSA